AALDGGQDVNARCPLGYTALTYAVWSRSLPMITLLLDRGAYINVTGRVGWGWESKKHAALLSEVSLCLDRVRRNLAALVQKISNQKTWMCGY
ncbi:MAG: hypothetical protein WC443_10800, partial [Desulfobaccales bacterium]